MKHTDLLAPPEGLLDQNRNQARQLELTCSQSEIISGLSKTWIHLKLRWTLVTILIHCYRNPLDWIRGLRYLIRLRRRVMGKHRLRKMVRVNGLYYMGLYSPGWNDETYRRFIASELYHFKPHGLKTNRLNQVFMAVTKKCPLQCEHCYAWDTLNTRDELNAEQYLKILAPLREMGISQVYFTGGEPLLRMQVLEPLIRALGPSSKSWLSTSGFRLTREKAARLKQSGLTGVFISLDHYDPEKHNAFRHYDKAYEWALEGAKNALGAGLVVAFSICLSDEICRESELIQYMELARDTGVHFVQFFEPKAVGHYRGKDVTLNAQAIEHAEAFFLKMNFGREHLDYPIISYHGYYQRRVGCFGGGKRGIYVDADGNLNACPFCHKSYGNLLVDDPGERIEQMAVSGCNSF